MLVPYPYSPGLLAASFIIRGGYVRHRDRRLCVRVKEREDGRRTAAGEGGLKGEGSSDRPSGGGRPLFCCVGWLVAGAVIYI